MSVWSYASVVFIIPWANSFLFILSSSFRSQSYLLKKIIHMQNMTVCAYGVILYVFFFLKVDSCWTKVEIHKKYSQQTKCSGTWCNVIFHNWCRLRQHTGIIPEYMCIWLKQVLLYCIEFDFCVDLILYLLFHMLYCVLLYSSPFSVLQYFSVLSSLLYMIILCLSPFS